MDRYRYANDRDGRAPRVQYTTHHSSTCTFIPGLQSTVGVLLTNPHAAYSTTQSHHRGRPSQHMRPANTVAGPSRSAHHGHARSRSVPRWIHELPRDRPMPPPVRPATPPRTRFVQFERTPTLAPSSSISSRDRRQSGSLRDGRDVYPRGEAPRVSSQLVRDPDSQSLRHRDARGYDRRPPAYYPRNEAPRASSQLARQPDQQSLRRRDAQAYDRRPATYYPEDEEQWDAVGPEPERVVNNYMTTNNNQQYNIDNSYHQLINAQGQRNSTNVRYRSSSSNRGPNIDNSRTRQHMSSSGRQHHRRSRHYDEYRD